MKGVVLYDTAYGNTQKVAEVIAEALREKGLDVDIYDIAKVGRLSAADYDFVVVGSPTKMNTMSFVMKRFLGKFKGEGWRGKPFFAFDTELVGVPEKSGGSAREKIQKELEERGMKPLVPVLKAEVAAIKGPLVSDAVKKAKEHAMNFASKLGHAGP